MRYPIDVNVMKKVYREYLTGSERESEYNEHDEAYICALTEVVNAAYERGVEDGMKQAGEIDGQRKDI